MEKGLCTDPALAELAAERSDGSLERAVLWLDESVREFRQTLLEMLAQPEIDLQPAAKLLSQFVDEAGKDSAAKRKRLRLVVSLAEEFYRAALLASESGQQSGDVDLKKAVAAGLRWIAADAPALCLDVCLDAYAHIDANVNQATFVEWWLDALSTAGRTGAAVA
jgi:DNA polymerase-3 subunit delta'